MRLVKNDVIVVNVIHSTSMRTTVSRLEKPRFLKNRFLGFRFLVFKNDFKVLKVLWRF